MDNHEIIAYVEQSRSEQGLPPRVTDAGVLRQIANLTITPTTSAPKKGRKAVRHA